MKIQQGKGKRVWLCDFNPRREECILEMEQDYRSTGGNLMYAFTCISKEEALGLAEGLRQFIKTCNKYAATKQSTD